MYAGGVAWEINGTDEFAAWYHSLSSDEQDTLIATVELLAEQGPALGRPRVDTIKGSEYANMKELRPHGAGKHLRVLFIFDPRRQAILLTGGNKQGNWVNWYREAIPRAEQLYAVYLDDLRSRGTIE
ncbi:MAG: diaminopimelate decarboxylase [Actinobacteria bacterium]|nr:MAG: diaminopimelate decarboxylase [Actinomycetota bacterium]